MERINFIQHQGKKILHLDFSKSKNPSELAEAISYAKKLVAEHPPKSLMVLTDVTESLFTTELVNAMKDLAKCNAPYVKASAVLGVTGMKKYLFNALLQFSGRKIYAFEDAPSAREWLVKQN